MIFVAARKGISTKIISENGDPDKHTFNLMYSVQNSTVIV